MRLLIVASAALALLCTPALAVMGKHPGARAPIDPGENVKVPPGHTGYDTIVIPAQNAGAPDTLPADGRKRLACLDLSQIQDIFNQPNIDIPSKFAAYEAQSYQRINALIDALPTGTGLRKQVFRAFLAKVYKRAK